MKNIVEKLRRIAGFSNYKDLLNRCLTKLDKVIDRVYPKGGFTLKLDEEGDKDYNIIKVKLGPGLHTSVREFAKGHQIDIDTEEFSKERVYMSIAHEVTHISQHMNNFRNFQFDMLRKIHPDIKPKNWGIFMDSIHESLETENEAIMVQIAVALKRGNIDLAVEEMLNRGGYFKTWNWRKFATKLYSVGVTDKDIKKLRQELTNIITTKISTAIKESKDVGVLADSITKIGPLLHLIEYNTTKLKNILLERIDALYPKPVGYWNWPILRKLVEKL